MKATLIDLIYQMKEKLAKAKSETEIYRLNRNIAHLETQLANWGRARGFED